MDVISDQARSMELAIEAELQNTVHRWCKWHVGESPGYIAYYADNFNRTRLEEDIPRRMLYETLAAQCSTAPRAGFMVQVVEEI
ncbi:hypothetical protein ZWY2020_039681 [Hordeum vulgare]|nr:hypothetical protein ZWY2020_039681 [Hordeum vulgare]